MILAVTVGEKFATGGWVTLAVTGGCVGLCLAVSSYYRRVNASLRVVNEHYVDIVVGELAPNRNPPDPSQATALILVGGYSGLGVHTVDNSLRTAAVNFSQIPLDTVGVVDSCSFKGAEALDELRDHTQRSLDRYVDLAQRLGFASTSCVRIGADVVDELEDLCVEVARTYPRLTIFTGQLIFQRDTWYQRLLHNFTAFALQRRLQWRGLSMVILPTRVDLQRGRPPALPEGKFARKSS